MKKINLNLINVNIMNEELYEKYIKNLTNNIKYKYKKHEISGIKALLNLLVLDNKTANNFYYSYSIPQIGKEFDLLKFDSNKIINIEIKSEFNIEKIKNQLIQNKYYLSFLKQVEQRIYSFCSENNKFFKLIEDAIVEVAFEEVRDFIRLIDTNYEINIDNIFVPTNYLVSPLNNTDVFLKSKYFLTIQQENIKKELLNCIKSNNKYYLINGKAGTGKTLLLYDIVKTIALSKNVCVIHCGTLCDGHNKLNKTISNLKIIGAAVAWSINRNNYNVVFIDECYRITEKTLEYIVNYCIKKNVPCIMFGDSEQKLSNAEERRDLIKTLTSKQIYLEKQYTLSNKIRTNHQLSNFIKVLFNLNEEKKYNFDNVDIVYAYNYDDLKKKIVWYESINYHFIGYTPSKYRESIIDSLSSETFNTHRVIGQEFDNIVMYLDNNFYYSTNKKITGRNHPCPNYIYTKLLFQGLTRARNKIALIIVNNEPLLNDILNKIN